MSSKSYGQLILEARSKTDRQEIGETCPEVMKKFEEIINDAVQKNYENGVKGKYYIHIWVTKEPNTPNSLHIYPQCRRTRPSPYQGHDHYLWSVQEGGRVTFEWCIPKKEVLGYILQNPNEFDANYVRMLRNFCDDKLERIEDYFLEGKIQ
jgi:hypothetical protein